MTGESNGGPHSRPLRHHPRAPWLPARVRACAPRARPAGSKPGASAQRPNHARRGKGRAGPPIPTAGCRRPPHRARRPSGPPAGCTSRYARSTHRPHPHGLWLAGLSRSGPSRHREERQGVKRRAAQGTSEVERRHGLWPWPRPERPAAAPAAEAFFRGERAGTRRDRPASRDSREQRPQRARRRARSALIRPCASAP